MIGRYLVTYNSCLGTLPTKPLSTSPGRKGKGKRYSTTPKIEQTKRYPERCVCRESNWIIVSTLDNELVKWMSELTPGPVDGNDGVYH
jgi:hypothetical protein